MELISRVASCIFCKHLKDDFICDAFPNGIPDEILSGDNPHIEPLKEQKNDIIFEPKVSDKDK